MIKFVVARYENDRYENFLGANLEEENTVHIFNEQASSIFEKYNLGIQHHIESGLDDEDILVFCHADTKILDADFKEKLEYAFKTLPQIGVAGVIGTTQLHETGGWWLCDHVLHRGHLMQWVDNEEKNKYHMVRRVGNFLDMVAVDGLIMFVRGKLAKAVKFDEKTYQNSYNFYDLDYCLTALESGMKVAVLDILVEHGSAGAGIYQEDWVKNKEVFLNKWKSKGYVFPLASKG